MTWNVKSEHIYWKTHKSRIWCSLFSLCCSPMLFMAMILNSNYTESLSRNWTRWSLSVAVVGEPNEFTHGCKDGAENSWKGWHVFKMITALSQMALSLPESTSEKMWPMAGTMSFSEISAGCGWNQRSKIGRSWFRTLITDNDPHDYSPSISILSSEKLRKKSIINKM